MNSCSNLGSRKTTTNNQPTTIIYKTTTVNFIFHHQDTQTMILTYSLDRFVDAIQSGTKIHTLREDPHRRWKPGMKIQHWRGNPRNTRGKVKPYHFADGECKGIQDITIYRNGTGIPTVYVFPKRGELSGRMLSDAQVEQMAKNDRLSVDEFREWFVPESLPECRVRIIHFTSFRY